MRPEPCILAFDTSAAHCAAALLSGGRVVADAFEPMEKGQAERLLPLCAEVMARAGVAWGDLDAVAVGTGPGNFTGVRIAVAAARGLALSLGVPAIGVTRLEALAEGLARPVTVIEDAKRGEVYVQRFDAGGAGVAGLRGAGVDLPDGAVTGSAAGAGALPPAMPLHHAIAVIAARRFGTEQPRPAPFYMRGADAAPPSDPPPVILP
ncbi:tRNA (adenosine(37)-N6)-threonylcarbamoyltransferase complex dimerization subunit type 1 TsaB [Rhodobacteraceae bacterium HSP-20]|uniref:tRNA (Adenosine(37)-N6)-threonylcarbamoyltransferase complex dimerization subunit type 1 TsaB n=1 Tax=Paragemmobacter amnigenus TaxID=2852097 RepID=A0ABS6JAE6_9RHOB|nr:tRNA (adenosine(37)-N6)-threonylcarbamoyltransferase complex dimerization subunit type 1 TsaB [Rhodobacter amnigenus]MBU9699869.1 tRNA (adenosine(37)-N6)-threonylcarbamoyltransferase complex dimerization subunit type 1 TsaB [Rhodobacter amnigenus]MBV4391096.1 tRNA (adenosine(37)-N6)-threonylcarbamoyltransferase complex dimerization subunit type 1 TsaB [Rhodobacter amnigenus]